MMVVGANAPHWHAFQNTLRRAYYSRQDAERPELRSHAVGTMVSTACLTLLDLLARASLSQRWLFPQVDPAFHRKAVDLGQFFAAERQVLQSANVFDDLLRTARADQR